MAPEIAPDPFLNAEFDLDPHKIITIEFNGSSEAAQTIVNMLLKIHGVVGAEWDYA